MQIFTIGFTKSTAQNFFNRLRTAGVHRVLDTRLNKDSQLAGFAKQADLPYFLNALASASYVSADILAPTDEMLKDYRGKKISWREYERRYVELLERRAIEKVLQPEQFEHACLLCSEATPEHCHRRLAAEYLARKWGTIRITHL